MQQLTEAALTIYFGKTTNETAFTFGIPGHGRSSEKQRNIVGMFSNILPFKNIYNHNETLRSMLDRIKIQRKESLPYRNYLAGDLNRGLKMGIEDSYLNDITINYVPFNFDLDYGDQLKANTLRVPSEKERIPLQIFWREYGNDKPFALGMQYMLEYFNEREIELFSERLIYIIEQFPLALSSKMSSINIVPPAEKLLLKSFSNPVNEALPYNVNTTIVGAFEARVKRTPVLNAVNFENTTITYGELNKKANQLANYLKSKGIVNETLVPICIERGIEMVIGIMGILKAGAAFVPVDPENPEERIKFILNDISATLVLSSVYGKTRIGDISPLEIVMLDSEWGLISKQPVTGPEVTIQTDHLAYVCYTSGSTGTPKGVLIEHKSYLNTNNCYYKILPGEQTILTCNYVFDAAVLEMMSSLLGGGCLNIPPLQVVTDVKAYAGYLYNRKISTAYIHPMFLAEVADILSRHSHCYLTRLLIAVEPVKYEAIKWYLDKGISVLNGYGPTETAISATFFKVVEEGSISQIIPIGKPMNNVQVIIANGLELAPIGVTGEILIGGAGLARGYLNQPDITAEKFVENSFNDALPARLYKSGDLARWMPDGNIEFIGRTDNQVKVKGYRIEPGEIENALMQSKLIKQCVVMAITYGAGDKRLVAFVVSAGIFNMEAIVTYLKNKLPQYMVPAAWVEMEGLPTTVNGKIDRKALPWPEQLNVATNEFIVPRNAVEVGMVTIWKSLLQLEKISINDNFFQIGGHSLLAVQLISVISRETGKNIEVSDLVKNPTIEKLARFVTSGIKANNYKFLTPIKTSGENIPLFIVCGPGGTTLPFYKFAALLDAPQRVYAFQQPINPHNDATRDISSLEDIAATYIEEMLLETPEGPYALAGHCLGGIVAFEMARQLKLKGKAVKLLAMFDTVIGEEKQAHPLSKQYKKDYKTRLKGLAGKIYSKLNFEMYLLTNHPRHAIAYKTAKINAVLKTPPKHKYPDGDSFTKKWEQKFTGILENYKLSDYDGDILIFYAKDHYRFTDRDRNIFYKWFPLAERTKNRWKNHAPSAKIYEIAGDHLTIFENEDAPKFAAILQGHLNTYSG